MICAYDKVYLDYAKRVLGRMLDFAVHNLHYNIEEFFSLFIKSGVAERFGKGDYTILVGKSGIEVAYDVLEKTKLCVERVPARHVANRSEEYWTGWALAHYQWETALSFNEIVKYIPIHYVQALYSPYHEMDIRHFIEKMNELYRNANPDTNLKKRRKQVGLSQSELAKLSGVPVRTIQQYEQRQKNINKAQVEYLFKLSVALGCNVECLIEKV